MQHRKDGCFVIVSIYNSMEVKLWSHNLHQSLKKFPWKNFHCLKSVRIRRFSGPHFPAVFLRIQSKCGKMRARATPNTDTFYAVLVFLEEIWKLSDQDEKKTCDQDDLNLFLFSVSFKHSLISLDTFDLNNLKVLEW